MARKKDRVVRPWRTPRIGRVVEPLGAAEILGIAKSTLYKWLQPGSGNGSGFPPDDTYLIPPVRAGKAADDNAPDEGTMIWDRGDIIEFAELKGRRHAKPGEAVWLERRRANQEYSRAHMASLEKELEHLRSELRMLRSKN